MHLPCPVSKKLLVGTGLDSSGHHLSSFEMVNLCDQDLNNSRVDPIPEFVCDIPPEYPGMVSGAVSGMDDIPIICGGIYGDDDCFTLNSNGWIRIPRLPKPLWRAGSVSLNGGIQFRKRNFRFALWVTGGQSHSGLSDTTFLLTNQGSGFKWEQGPDLPDGFLHSHCVVELNGEETMVVGGSSEYAQFSSKTWIFNWGLEKWRHGPPLMQGRSGHVCGRVFRHNSELDSEIVVVSGRKGEHVSDALRTSEFLDLKQYRWNEGPKVPVPVLAASMVEIDRNILLIGGITPNDGPSSDIFELGIGFVEWKHRKEHLLIPRAGHISVIVPENFGNCTNYLLH